MFTTDLLISNDLTKSSRDVHCGKRTLSNPNFHSAALNTFTIFVLNIIKDCEDESFSKIYTYSKLMECVRN